MTTRLALVAALMLATSTASAQAPRARQAPPAAAPTAPPAAAKPPAPGAPEMPGNNDVTDSAGFKSFSATPFYKGLIKHTLDDVPPEVFQRCPGLVSAGSKVTILKPLHFADGVPVAGVWKHSFPVRGCGADTILNFYFIATPEKRINTLIGLPGTTHVEPTLQHDTETYAFTRVTNTLRDTGKSPCARYAVRNTTFEAYGLDDPPTPDPGPTEPGRPWRESWTVAGCGHTFLVPLNFAPHTGGIEIKQPGHVTELSSSEVAHALPPPTPPAASVPPVAPPPRAEPLAGDFTAVPGSTHANLRQQREAQTRTFSAAALTLQDQGGAPCPSYAITNTKFEAFGLENPPTPDPGPTAAERPWWESWTAAGCGRQFLVPLNFIPHGGLVEIDQPGHVTQPLLVDPSQIRNPYAKDVPPPRAAPAAAPPAGKP